MILSTNACLDPAEATIGTYADLLVVDGLITNNNESFTIKIGRTSNDTNQDFKPEVKCEVSITDDLKNEFFLTEKEPGLYSTDQNTFVTQIGRRYQLHIRTSSGKIYQSDACLLNEPLDITDVYYQKEKDVDSESGQESEGLAFYVNTAPRADCYLRWSYKEDWKFIVPYPVRYYVSPDKQLHPIEPVVNEVCWRANVFNNINIHYINTQGSTSADGKKLYFKSYYDTDRFEFRYSVLVRQYTINKEEYNFWNKIKDTNYDSGNLFGNQPYSIVSNIHNINDKGEPILGFFQVASFREKRIYINQDDLKNYGFKPKQSGCSPYEVLFETNPYLNLDIYSSYKLYVGSGNYSFIYPLYTPQGAIFGIKLTSLECADCVKAGGVLNAPSFWVEE